LFACLSVAVYAVLQTRRYERNFGSVVLGTNQERVRELLGRPASVTDGTKAEYGFSRSKTAIRSDVAEEYWYYCMYAPEVWAVSFGKDRKVVTTYRLSSP
jgi:hypothetical protein